jgi:hypothetical protein
VFSTGIFVLSLGCGPAESEAMVALLELPQDLELQEDEPQVYRLTCDYSYRDLYGNIKSRKRIVGEYVRALAGGYSEWRNVRISEAPGADGPFGEGDLQDYLEGFRYRPSEVDLFDESFFAEFPPGMSEPRVLIYDMAMAESFAWEHFGKLRLNEAYLPEPDAETMELGEGGTFQNRDLRITWIGSSDMNGERSAIIQYRSLFNPMDLKAPGMSIKGKTNYWGEVWVSLEDKQIEFATLYEDGLMEIAPESSTKKTIINVFREMVFEKVLPPS